MHLKLTHCFLPLALLVAAITADADTFFVANSGQNSITRVDAEGGQSVFASSNLQSPRGVAIDSAGNVYVSNSNNSIRKFSPEGVDLGAFAASGLVSPQGLAFDAAGNLYVANSGNNTIAKFDPSGNGTIFATVTRPAGLAFDAAGVLYVTTISNTVERFASNGGSLGTFTSVGLSNPQGLAFDAAGNLYVANFGTSTIEKFSSSGAHLGAFAGTGLNGPVGLAFDSAGDLYVVNARSANIIRFTPDGSSTVFGNTGFNPAFIAVQTAGHLANISTRLRVLTGDKVLIGGFIVTGSGSRTVLLRGLGPSLTSASLDDVLADPELELHTSGGTTLATNKNWKDTQHAAIQSTGIAPTRDAEAAIFRIVPPGSYTVVLRGENETSGIGLVELYDLTSGGGSEVANISSRGFVDNADSVIIGGFIIQATTGGNADVLVRAIGPSLNARVPDALQDTLLELHDGDGTILANNDNWKQTQQAAIQATTIPPSDDRESAILATLPPGNYTAIVRGKNNATGVALVEAYRLR